MLIVIADDITGAAEIAGIASSRGLQVRFVCGSKPTANETADVTVVATDTRSMTEPEAVAETLRVAASLGPDCGPASGNLLFKKTDSALRGHVVAELSALMQATGFSRAVYLPANPSKGRVISSGIYYIKEPDGTLRPIADTDFSFDPEFPARTSVLAERFPDAAARHIVMPDAETADDIRHALTVYNDGRTILAGAADLFSALLTLQKPKDVLPSAEASTRPLLILCGSTQSRPLHLGIPVSPMPLAVYDGSVDLSSWVAEATARYQEGNGLILTIPHHHRTGKSVAVHLRMVMARMAQSLVAAGRPGELIVEGGATAYATLQQLGWQQLTVVRQIAPGVVRLQAACGTFVTLKPGSYSWGGLFG